jgi:hypothetical protein
MATPIHGFKPPGGWHYKDGEVLLEAGTLNELYSAVESYRAENYLPIGDVKGDIHAFLCGSYPTYCHGVDMVVVTSVTPPNRESELLGDITTWAKNILNSNKQIRLVSDELAEARARTCLDCPRNINWRAGCGACIVAADRISASIRKARDTDSTPRLGGCAVMRHDNRSAVFFDSEHFEPSGDLPAKCWLKQTT